MAWSQDLTSFLIQVISWAKFCSAQEDSTRSIEGFHFEESRFYLFLFGKETVKTFSTNVLIRVKCSSILKIFSDEITWIKNQVKSGDHAETHSIKYVPLQVNRFQKNILLIVQYKYLRSFSGDFNSLESHHPQDHAVMVLLLNLVGFFISNWPRWSGGNFLHHSCTSFEGASRKGQPLNVFTLFIGAGGVKSGPKIGPTTGLLRSVIGSPGNRVGLTRISSQLPVSDLGEWRHIRHFFRWQKMWRVTFFTFLGRMWRSCTRKYFFELVTFFVTSFPKNVTIWPLRY